MTPFPRIPRWFFSVILATALLAFAACGKTAHTRSSKAVSGPVAVKKAPPAKPAGPAVEPDAGKADADEQPITPAGLIATLEGHLDAEVLEVPQAFLGVVGKALGKPLMPGSFLKALVVQSEDGFVGAFLGVVPPGHVPCSEEPSERPRVFWVSRTGAPGEAGLQVLEVSTQVFDGGLPRLEMPETYPGVPFVELQDSRLCPMPGAVDPADSPEGHLMEAWALTAEGPRLIRRLESISEIPAGHSSTTTGTLSWILADGGAFYLAAREFVTSSTPANSAPVPGDDDADVVIVRCEAQTWVYKLDARGQATLLTAKQLAPLRKSVPALAALPADGRGKSEDACMTLEGL